MGQNPAKIFPQPTPYGQSPDLNVLSQAQSPTPAPSLNLPPLQGAADPQSPAQMQQGAPQPQMYQGYQPGRLQQGRFRYSDF